MTRGRRALVAVALLGACAPAVKPTKTTTIASASAEAITSTQPSASNAGTTSASASASASTPTPTAMPAKPPLVRLASLDGEPRAIALDATHAYVLTNKQTKWKLSRIAKTGGALALLDDFEAASLAFALGESDVFVGSGMAIHEATNGGAFRVSAFGRISSGPKTGGTRVTLYEAIGRSARGLALGGSHVFWLNGSVNGGGGVTVDAVMKTPRAGGPTTYLAMQQWGATSVAADDTNVFWTMQGRPDPRARGQANEWPRGAIMRTTATGGAPRVVVATAPQPTSLALDSESLYWMHPDGRVMRAPKKGGPALVFAEHVRRFALTDACVWWIGNDGGLVSRSKEAASAPEPRDIGGVAAMELAVDSSGLFVADANGLYVGSVTAAAAAKK